MIMKTMQAENGSRCVDSSSSSCNSSTKHYLRPLIAVINSLAKNSRKSVSFRTLFPISLPSDLTVSIEIFWQIDRLKYMFLEPHSSIINIFLIPSHNLTDKSNPHDSPADEILFNLTVSTLSIPKHYLDRVASSSYHLINGSVFSNPSCSHLVNQFAAEGNPHTRFRIYTLIFPIFSKSPTIPPYWFSIFIIFL